MKRWQIILGIVLILIGLLSLFEVVFEFSVGPYIFPLILIGLGIFVIFRPKFIGSDTQVEMRVFGDIRKTGSWKVEQYEIWSFVGTNRLDFSEAQFPDDEVKIKIFGFVAEVVIVLPVDVGLLIRSNAFVSELKTYEGKYERLFNSLEYRSSNYDQASKRVEVDTVAFVSEIRVKSPLL